MIKRLRQTGPKSAARIRMNLPRCTWGHGVRSCLLPPPFSARSWGQVLPFGLVLGIANLITFHGDSVALFEAALHAAVAGYVDACRRLGDAPEKLAMAA